MARKTRDEYEEWLNGLLDPNMALWLGAYMDHAEQLLSRGKWGTALRKYDPAAFNAGFKKWSREGS